MNFVSLVIFSFLPLDFACLFDNNCNCIRKCFKLSCMFGIYILFGNKFLSLQSSDSFDTIKFNFLMCSMKTFLQASQTTDYRGAKMFRSHSKHIRTRKIKLNHLPKVISDRCKGRGIPLHAPRGHKRRFPKNHHNIVLRSLGPTLVIVEQNVQINIKVAKRKIYNFPLRV